MASDNYVGKQNPNSYLRDEENKTLNKLVYLAEVPEWALYNLTHRPHSYTTGLMNNSCWLLLNIYHMPDTVLSPQHALTYSIIRTMKKVLFSVLWRRENQSLKKVKSD